MEAFITIKKLQKLLASKKLSSKEITSYYLENIQKHDESINSFIHSVSCSSSIGGREASARMIKCLCTNKLFFIPALYTKSFALPSIGLYLVLPSDL